MVAAVRVRGISRVVTVSEDALKVCGDIGVNLAPRAIGRYGCSWSVGGTSEPDEVSSIFTLPAHCIWIRCGCRA